MRIELSCTVNGVPRKASVYPMARLLAVLREQMRLTGRTEGGGEGECGMCTPGMILAAVNLLERIPHPTEAEIRNGLAGNLCRCTGYVKIFEAVVKACES